MLFIFKNVLSADDFKIVWFYVLYSDVSCTNTFFSNKISCFSYGADPFPYVNT